MRLDRPKKQIGGSFHNSRPNKSKTIGVLISIFGFERVIYESEGKTCEVYRVENKGEIKAAKVFFRDEMLELLDISDEVELFPSSLEATTSAPAIFQPLQVNSQKIIEWINDKELKPLLKMTNTNSPVSPHVMHCIDETVYRTGDYFVIFLPFYKEGDLFKKITESESESESESLSENNCKKYLRGILIGLQAMHRNGLYHRDIKLENVMLENGEAVIIDFGCCTQEMETKYRTLNNMVGTDGYRPYFISEIVDGKISNEKLDIWAAGVLLYVMLFVEYPFKNPPNSVGEVFPRDARAAEKIILEKGDSFHVPVLMRHQLIGLTDVEMFEFSTQHFDEDSIRVIKGD